MSSVGARSVGGTPRSSFDAIFDSNSLQNTRRRTSSTWKRVASLYSSPKQKEVDDGPDEDMWDNNDQDFQHQIMIEAKLQSKARLRPSIDEIWLNGATSMEEVASPNELLSPYSHANSHAASSSTPTLLTSFSDSPSLLGTPSFQQSHSSAASNPRPSSTTNASLMTSKSYSTLSSEASTAPTFPSPASSKAELRARQRYSGGNARLAALCGAESRTSMSEDISPTSATFEQSSPNSKLAKNQISTLSSSLSGHLQFGGWTQEQIDSPGAEADRQFGSLGSFAGAGSISEEISPSKYIASATVDDVMNARTYSQDPILSEELPDISTANRHRGKALSALLGEPEEVILASKKLEDEKMLPPLPPLKTKATDYRNSEQSLISGLKKKLLPTKRTGGSPVKNKSSSSSASVNRSKTTTSIVASNSLPLYTSLSDNADFSEAQAVDQNRRPSLPHISTMPSMPTKRRLSMQHSSPGIHSSFDSKAQNDVQETLVDSHSEESTPEPLSFQRKPSMESIFSRISRPSDGRMARSRSRTETPRSNRNSIVEHVSYDHARKRSSIASLGITPDMVNEIVPTSPSTYYNAAGEDVCEELKGETSSIEEDNNNRRFSISSQSSKAPIRPVRQNDNAPLQRQPSIDSINPHERSSLENSFNAAHSKRWSTVGPAFLTYIDPQKTSAIEANAQNDYRPASPFENIFKGGRRDSEASLSLKKIVSNGSANNTDMFARDSISSTREDSLRTGANSILSPSLAPEAHIDEFGKVKTEIDIQDLPKSKSPVKLTKTWSRRRSFVEPTTNRLSNLIKTGLGRKTSGLLQSTSPNSKLQKSKIKTTDKDGDVLDLSLNGWVEDSLSADRSLDSYGTWVESNSPATASFTGSSANRSSAGASSLNQTESQSMDQQAIDIPTSQRSTDMRPSRSTHELGSERLRTWHNGSSTNLISTLSSSSSNNTKRPTFGLDLQPDAASAFDSIPLPETPERSRSRAGSISSSTYGTLSNEHLVLPPPVIFPSRSDGRTSGEEVTNEPDVYRKASTVSDRTLSLSMPSDLPADVDDVENLLDDEEEEEEEEEEYGDIHDQTLTGDETLTKYESKRSHALPSPSTDEVELLEDDDDFQSNQTIDQVSGDSQSNGQLLLNDSENDSNSQKGNSTSHTYRFPPARSSMEDSRSTTSLLIPNKSDNAFSPVERINQQNSPVFKPILASHLRRPSSSASYV
ncbi:hypothetical protein L7F22_043671 [Adiantum nelumboides]|nr:hypothetical protein [Adiantum nelumboides]